MKPYAFMLTSSIVFIMLFTLVCYMSYRRKYGDKLFSDMKTTLEYLITFSSLTFVFVIVQVGVYYAINKF